MALIRRARFWHFDFVYKGERFQGSTDQTNVNKARLVQAKIRSEAALERFGIGSKKVPMFRVFLEGKFLDEMRSRHSHKPNTLAFYRLGVARILEYEPFAKARLDAVDAEMIADYTRHRSRQPKRSRGAGTVGIIAINRELAALSHALSLADEWRLIPRKPKVRKLPGEKGREFILPGELEVEYLAACRYPLKQAAILMLDLGLRPHEAAKIRKTDIGTRKNLSIPEGKTHNAARILPLTQRCVEVIELVFALWPDSPWLFPGSKGKHINPRSLDNAHLALRKKHGWPEEFVIYSFRHTAGSRLAESGASPFEVAKFLGHADIRTTQRYVHPSTQGLALAMKRMEALGKIMRGEIHSESSTNSLLHGSPHQGHA